MAGTWEQIRAKVLRAFGGMTAGPLVATCLGTPSNSIIVSQVPVGQKNLKRLVSVIELKPLKPRSSFKLQSKLKPSKTQKSQTPCQRDWNWKTSKISKQHLAHLALFLRSPGDILNCSICLMPVFGDMYIDFGLPKVVLPSTKLPERRQYFSWALLCHVVLLQFHGLEALEACLEACRRVLF